MTFKTFVRLCAAAIVCGILSNAVAQDAQTAAPNTGDDHPVSWKVSSEQIAPLTYRIKCEATIEPPFHIYPQESPDGGGGGIGIPTKFDFAENGNAEFVGPVEEHAADKEAGEEVAYYARRVTFVQTVRLKSEERTPVSFSVKFQACNEVMCLPPATETFTLTLGPNLYKFDEFMLIEKVEDQEKVYNQMLKALPADKTTPEATNSHRAELAYGWLARGNVERYRHYKATRPKFNPRQLMYLCDALEKMTDVKRQYAEVQQLTRELLDDIEKKALSDGIGKRQVLMELNAVSNAMLGNVDLAREMMAKASEVKNGGRDMNYFRDSKSSYLHRQALILSAAGEHHNALDLLSKAFRDADSNPNMVPTFREMYSKVKGTEKGFEPYLESLRDEAYRKYYEEGQKTYIATPQQTLEGVLPLPGGDRKMKFFSAKQPVHEISILDLEGKPVDLGAYKGRILAIDFWSTGCTPCVAAFAGFERVVADYKKRDFQMFVTDLFETQPTVKAYVAKKGITLDVLRDEENKAYDIQGTPTKIIFDPMGNIRFYAVGYAGSTDREYYKLKAMVEITRARSSGAAQ